MNPLLRQAAAHVFVESLEAPVLEPSDEHHLRRVLRVDAREAITVCDGKGRWVPGRLGGGGVEVTGPVTAEPEPRRSVVACAIPKGDRPEWVVQKLTELGVGQVVLYEAERSVVRWDTVRAEKHLQRLRRVALEASMQSRRVWLPAVDVLTWAEVSKLAGAALAEPGGGPLAPDVGALVVGPEGGFSAAELATGLATVSLGEQVLRVETAAIVAGVLLTRRAPRTPGNVG